MQGWGQAKEKEQQLQIYKFQIQRPFCCCFFLLFLSLSTCNFITALWQVDRSLGAEFEFVLK